jgi:hypothetical protein
MDNKDTMTTKHVRIAGILAAFLTFDAALTIWAMFFFLGGSVLESEAMMRVPLMETYE